jgi:putative hydrolase of the HAD superfamily
VSAPVLLVDYGGVISRQQPEAAVVAMAELIGLELPVFNERYWRHRPAHDRGVEAGAYWAIVAGRELDHGATIEELVRIDVASWSHLNQATLEVLREAHDRGVSMSVLSNAPREMAAVLRVHPAMEIFDQLIFSSEIGVVKPDPAAFAVAVQRLGRPAADVLFIDDRPDNVTAAIEMGLHGLLFTSAEQLSADLPRFNERT